MLAEHLTVFEHLIAGQRAKAQKVLEGHLRRSMTTNVERLGTLGTLPETRRAPFLIPAS